MVQQSITTLLTKMNGLLLTRSAPESNLPPPCRGRKRPCGHRYFFQQPSSNASLRFLASRELLKPPLDILTPSILLYRGRCRQCPAKFIPAELLDNTVPISSVVLEEDFCLREDTYLTFPLEVNNLITREAIGHFPVNIENVIKHMDHVYYCCSQFVDFSELKSISNNNAVLMTIFETYILYCYNLDVCGCCSESFNFCHNCWTCVSGSKKPKFGISNKMPQLYCHYYPAFLEDLISAEKVVIARAHPVVTILKLKLNNNINLGTYRGVCRHFVLLP